MASRVLLIGSRLSLQPLAREHEALYLGLYGDPETMARILAPLDAAAARRAFQRELAEAEKKPAQRATWAICGQPDGEAFGLIGLVMDGDAGAEVGVVLAPEHQGRGHASEAISLLASHAFLAMGLRRLHTRHADGHGLARGLMLRLGFRETDTGPPPHPIRWHLERESWLGAGRDKPGAFG